MVPSHSLDVVCTYMNESRSNQYTGTEVLAEEEYWRWDLHPLDLFCYYWKPSTEDGSKEYNDCNQISYAWRRYQGTLTNCSYV